jgi:O-antigen ligase
MSALRIGLCLVFAFSVLSFGAVEVWSQSVLEIAAAVLFLFWAILAYRNPDAKIQWSPLNGPLLGFLAIGFLQLLIRGTAYPFLTRAELAKLAAYFLVFFLTVQAFRARADLQKLAWFVILFCFAVSLLAIIQHFTSGSEIYWMSGLKIEGDPFGPYVNRNHFAGFVELTVPTGLALLAFRGMRRDLFPLATLLTIVPVSALVLSGSRGGIVGLVFEVGILVLLARSQRALHGGRVAAVVMTAAAALMFVAWVGTGRAVEKFSQIKPRDVSGARRISMARGALHILYDHPVQGCGLGTLVSVYPRYETAYDGRVVDHVHNDYVELLAETGLLGGLCGAMFLWLLYRESRKNFTAEQGHFSRGLHAGAIVAVSGMLLHSLVDFNLHIPANALLFLLQAYLATSLPLASTASASVPGLRIPD